MIVVHGSRDVTDAIELIVIGIEAGGVLVLVGAVGVGRAEEVDVGGGDRGEIGVHGLWKCL